MNAAGYPELDVPEVAFDFARLHAQWVPGDPYQPEAGTPGYYAAKARIAAWIKPTRVVEIGVRAGYSALAFHQGYPYTEFYGLDMDQGYWGGVAGYLDEALTRLSELPLTLLTACREDSQQIKVLPPLGKDADLFHVDGNHTAKGTAHDILLGLNNGARYIVVDDYDFTEYVTEGADWVIQRLGLQAWHVGDGGYRGNVVIAGKR